MTYVESSKDDISLMHHLIKKNNFIFVISENNILHYDIIVSTILYFEKHNQL